MNIPGGAGLAPISISHYSFKSIMAVKRLIWSIGHTSFFFLWEIIHKLFFLPCGFDIPATKKIIFMAMGILMGPWGPFDSF